MVRPLQFCWRPVHSLGTGGGFIRLSFQDEPLTLFGPGTNSGTFDDFTLAVVGTEHSSRKDDTKTEDETSATNGVSVLVNGVAGDRTHWAISATPTTSRTETS